MKKKLVALMMAVTMIIGSGLTVFAAEGDPVDIETVQGLSGGQTVTGNATTNLPIIKVTVPVATAIVINPYKVVYTDANDNESSNQVISVAQEIVNESNVAVQVNVEDLKVTAVKDNSGILIASKPVDDGKTTTKSAFLYLEVAKPGENFAASYDSKNAQQLVIPYVPASDTKAKPAAKENIVELPAGNTTATKAQFYINGSVVVNPTVTNSDKTVTAAPWTADDTITLSFKFTFEPQAVKTGTTTSTP